MCFALAAIGLDIEARIDLLPLPLLLKPKSLTHRSSGYQVLPV
jgi:hypothetical protein